jgi:sugar lactone lactonase YvrE
MVEVTRVLTAGALNGEGPSWCSERGRLFWIDVRAATLHLFDPATGQDECWAMPAWIGAYGLTEGGALVALRTGLYRFELATGALDFLAPSPCDPRRFFLNDGTCDPAGRFLVGAMYEPLAPGERQADAPRAAPLWRYDGAGGWEGLTDPVSVSNGLAWSPDGRTMYHADTKQRLIWAYDYDPPSGAVGGKRVFARVEEGDGPDGAAVDRDGFYWCAVFGGGCLLRFDPAGRLERRVPVPARYPTMPAFGGADLGTVFVTSANNPLPPEERLRHPDEGALFAFPAPVPGLPAQLAKPVPR